MFPEANVPVVPVSIQSAGGPQQAWRLGQALAPLAAQGFLIIGSGNVTHNLRDYQLAARKAGQTPAYVRQFSDWIADRLASHDIAALLDYRRRRRAPSRRTRARNICCRCLSHSVPVAKRQACSVSIPASTTTSSPWTPIHFCRRQGGRP
jgi:aromatic ring-opening dioxygenase catalytic subunit (LigB family)